MCMVLSSGNMLAGLKIIGKGTSSSVTPTTHIPPYMSPNSGPPRWVSKFVPVSWHMQMLASVLWSRSTVRIHVPEG